MQANRRFIRDAHHRHVTKGRRAFTLVELLASMTVLVLLVVMVSQLINSTVMTTVVAGKRIDSDSQSRLIFDRMGADFAGIVKQPDANFYFHHQVGNDSLYFFSNATGYFASSDPLGSASNVRNSLSLTGYRISDQTSGNTRFQMERLGRGLHWYDPAPSTSPNGPLTAMVYLPLTIAGAFDGVLIDPYNNSSNLRPSTSTSTNVPQWDVIGDQVVRMEFCFLLKDGTFAAVPTTQPTTATNNLSATMPPTASNDQTQGYTNGSRWYDTQAEIAYVCANGTANTALWNPLGLQDVRAVVVAVAILDSRSRLLTNAATLAKLSGLLPDFNGATPTMMEDAWNKVILDPNFASAAGLPQPAASSVRVYQRYFILN